MKLISITLIVFVTVLSACHDECEKIIIEDCITATLNRLDLERYHGQELECKEYLMLYTLNQQKFFMLNSACTDRIFSVFDCAGDEFCEPLDSDCAAYFTEYAEYVGIIGTVKG